MRRWPSSLAAVAQLGFLVVALLALGGACSQPPELHEALDLVTSRPLAQVHREVSRIDFGTPEARPHLLGGWSWNESSGDVTFVWSQGERSELRFYLAYSRDLPLRLRAFPWRYPEAPVQTLTVQANGRQVAQVELREESPEVTLELPATALRPGDNRLTFDYAYAAQPGRGDQRLLAARWEWLELGALDAPEIRADEERRLLELPYGSQMDYYLEPSGSTWLEIERLADRGAPGGRLEVLWRGEGGEEEFVTAWDRGAERAQELPGARGRAVRLSLRARPPEGSSEAGSLLLQGPRLSATEPSPGTSSVPSPAASEGVGTIDPRPAAEPRPHIVIYLVDTLRADRLGAYGQPRPLTPALDAFAGRATVFERAFAQSSWTKTSVASILTGLGPRMHGVNDPADALPESVPLLAEHLAAAGYQTAAFVTNAHISPASGFARGFDHFDFLPEAPNDAEEVDRRVFDWLDTAREPGAPLFLYVHTIDPHAPYAPPEAERRRFAGEVEDLEIGSVESLRALAKHELEMTPKRLADLRALYDAEVAYSDRWFGRFVDGLEQRSLFSGAMVAFLSDHGEEFHEHGVLGHGWDLYREVLQVPLIVKPPGEEPVAGRRVERAVQHLDLLPTISRLAGLEARPELRGRDLLRPPAPGSTDDGRVHSYMNYEGREGASVVDGDWHLIEPLSWGFTPAAELYDLVEDFRQQTDLAPERPIRAGLLRSAVRGELHRSRDGHRADRMELDAEAQRQLRALGYLGDAP